MATNTVSDQQRLIVDENDNPPTYQDATNQGSLFPSIFHFEHPHYRLWNIHRATCE